MSIVTERIAIFPGSFDPFTKGHEDVARRGAQMFDKLIIAIGNNSSKHRYIPVDVMISKIKAVFSDVENIEVTSFSGLTSTYAKEQKANYLLRGLRNTTDFEYENTIAQANHHVNPDLETVFLITNPAYAFISSSIVRELEKFGADASAFLPYKI